MNRRLAELVLWGLFAVTQSLSLATKTIKTSGDGVRAIAAPAIPTSTLVSDFKKNNVSSTWAEGHPKVWGAEKVKFEGPLRFDVSTDEKFIALAAGRNVTIRDLSNSELVSTVMTNFEGEAERVAILSAQNGGYDVFISSSISYITRVITGLHLSSEGTIIGEQTQYPGGFSTFDEIRSPFSRDGQRFLAITGTRPPNAIAVIYDIDQPDSNVTLVGHTDSIMSSAFSPDGQYVSTASWDGYGKVWNASTGELVHTFGPTGGQNWLTNFSPDGKYLLMTSAGEEPAVNIWPVADFSAEPIVFKGFGDWVRTASWTSDSKLLAVGSYGLIEVISIQDQKVVQRWESEDRTKFEAWNLYWIETESGLKLAYRETAGLEMYDFETNLKYRWGPDDYAQYNGGGSGDGTYALKSKGWIGGRDADQSVRFYEFPV
ncbi:WD40-repeat-containing domain protein [Astrocystis sublimbata]|nr:WD40-repeat-containing domain protein [Astrocystis sublimbata]